MDESSSVDWIDNESYSGTDSSEPGFSNVTGTPHTLRGRVNVTRKMMIQSLPEVEQLVIQDLAAIVDDEIDRVAICGSGADHEPAGLVGAAGVSVVSCGENGGAPDWSTLIDLQTAIDEQDAGRISRAYLTTPGVRGFLKKTPRHTTAVAGGWCWEGETIDGIKALSSTIVPANFTSGTHTDPDLHAIVFGDWSDLIVCRWGGLDILVDPFSDGDRGAVILRVFTDVDVIIRRPESFSVVTNADVSTA